MKVTSPAFPVLIGSHFAEIFDTRFVVTFMLSIEHILGSVRKPIMLARIACIDWLVDQDLILAESDF
jgi:hypothetical protein